MRCEDYPCCGHTDGDGCEDRAEHTSAFWLARPHLLDEDYDGAYGDYDEPAAGDDTDGSACPWCAGDDIEHPDPDVMCDGHLAEYEGVSVDELHRMYREQAADIM